jgi:hypothetical protein
MDGYRVEWFIDNRRAVHAVTDAPSPATTLAQAIEHAKGMLSTIRDRHPRRPPNGFRLLDETGAEVYCSIDRALHPHRR